MPFGTNVYVIDDDSLVRRSTVLMLTTAGYQARPFASGADFLSDLHAREPGCVVLDLRMPEIDGFDVLSAMSADLDRFPVVVATGHGDIGTAVQAMKLGAADFIEKPFDDAALVHVLERLGAHLVGIRSRIDERREAIRQIDTLTAREVEVLKGMVGGLPNKTLADRLSLSVRTVEMHRANLMEKLGVDSLADALRTAFLAELPAL